METRVRLIRLGKYAGICVMENEAQRQLGYILQSNKYISHTHHKTRCSWCRALKLCALSLLICLSCFQIGNRVLYMFFTHVRELFGDVVLKPVVRPLRWSNMATMPALPETQESIKEEIRRQVGSVLLQPICLL